MATGPQLLKVQNFNVSADGIAVGEDQSLEHPFGHVDPGRLFAWAGATASWPNRTDPGGSRGLDDHLVRDFHHDIGAEIMGRNKFAPLRGPWRDEDWKGWWGEEPPFHTPVFVLTHHERPSFTLSDTTFHFLDADPATALERAKEAAEGKDVRLGGGGDDDPGVPGRGPRGHPPRRRLPGEARPRPEAVGLPGGADRPLPPGRRPEPERGHPPPLLAEVTPRGPGPGFSGPGAAPAASP
ncbi:hypothetical protein ACVW0K_002128 [Streptomyces filamentosus]